MMIVLSMSNVPSRIRGDLTKWLLEIDRGVYIGNVNPRVRDGLWQRVCDNVENGRAIMVFSANNEQKLDFLLHNTERTVVDFDGLKLVKKPLPKKNACRKGEKAKAPFSRSRIPKHDGSSRENRRGHDAFPVKDYIILDIETTGLYPSDSEITEIGMVKVVNGAVSDTFACLIKTEKPVPQHITALTGINDELLREYGMDIGPAMQKMLAFAENMPIICYSKAFDRAFINKAAEAAEADVSKLCFYNAHSMIKSKLPGLEDYKLLTVAKALGVSEDQKHRALEDSMMLFDILCKLNKNDN